MQFGRYRLVEELDAGSVAVTSRAIMEGPKGFSRTLAVKRIRPGCASHPGFIQRLAAEARLSARLRHPNIVQVYEFDRVDGECYLAMELVEGATLSAVMRTCLRRNQRLPLAIACLVTHEVASALAYAHSMTSESGRPLELVHRNVSPSSIMVTPFGGVKLLDFGIARAVDVLYEDRTCTMVGAVRGRVGYLSPEQVEGRPIDRRSDLFALGVVLYELLTLRALFVRPRERETLQLIRRAKVVPPSTFVPGIPKDVDAAVLRLLARAPADRFASGDEVVAALTPILRRLDADAVALQEFLRGLGPIAPTAGRRPPGAPPTPPPVQGPSLHGEVTRVLPLSANGVEPPAPDARQALRRHVGIVSVLLSLCRRAP